VIATLPSDLVEGQYLAPDNGALAFSCLICLAGLLIVGLIPLALMRRATPLALLQGRIGELLLRAERFRQLLLVVQVTVTATLLSLAGLMVHSVTRAATYDYGFDSRRVLLFTPPFPRAGTTADLLRYANSSDPDFESRYREKQRRVVRTLETLEHTPGVVAAAGFFRVPLVDPGNYSLLEELRSIDGRRLNPPAEVHVNAVTDGFIRTLGATLVEGHGFDVAGSTNAGDIVIVNETFVRRFLPTFTIAGSDIQMNPLGKIVETRQSRGRIVGVIRDLVRHRITEPAMPQVFVRSDAGAMVAIRTRDSIEQATPAIRAALEAIWEEVPPRSFGLLQDAWREQLKPYLGQAELLTLIAVSSLFVAALGIFGFLTYSVRRRSREFAIRAVLGATPRRLRHEVIRRAVALVGFGAVGGAAVGAGIAKLIAHQLFEIGPIDAPSIVTVVAVLLGVAWLSAVLPAIEVGRTQPANALRDQ
jgi:hypothetical protein